jgi:phage tail-like protein
MIGNIGRRAVMKALGAAAVVGLTAGSAGAERTDRAADHGDGLFDTNGTSSFEVTLDGTTIGGWESVTIPGDATVETEYRDGTDSEHQRTTLGRTEYEDLEMERAVRPDDTSVFDWRDLLRQGRLEEARKTVVVTLLDGGEPAIRWEFTNAWVREYGAMELQAGGFGETATESVTVAFDEMRRTHP